MRETVILQSPLGELELLVYGERTVRVDVERLFPFNGVRYQLLRVFLHLRKDGRWQVHNALIKDEGGSYGENDPNGKELSGLVRDAVVTWAKEDYADALTTPLREKKGRLSKLISEEEHQLELHRGELATVDAELAGLAQLRPGPKALAELIAPALDLTV